MSASASVVYWVRAARQQVKWFVELRMAYRAEPHAHKRALLWQQGNRCRNRRPHLMAEARRYRVS